jgi:replicative DNA helicase
VSGTPTPAAAAALAKRARTNFGIDGASSLGLVPKDAPDPTPQQIADEQVKKAVDELLDEGLGGVPIPYPSVHELLGPLMPGRVIVVGANTGQGKTTLLLDLMDRCASADHRFYVLGLEQRPEELRTRWACLRADVRASYALEKKWREIPNGAELRSRVREEFAAQMREPWVSRVQFDPAKHVTKQLLREAAQRAEDFGAEVMAVDYIGRMKYGDKFSSHTEFVEAVQLCSDLADTHHLAMMLMSQLNRDASKGDRLAKNQPPQLQHLHGGGAIEHEADIVIGMHRPLRRPNPGETIKEYKAALASAREGSIQVKDVIEENTAVISCLKHRVRGESEGHWCRLAVKFGRISDIPERDRYATDVQSLNRV